MNKNDFIRFALVLSDGQATTFKKNLTKIIKLVLFDYFGQPLTIGEIIKGAKESYSLEFSEDEIKNTIKYNKSNVFIEVYRASDVIKSTYSISPEEYEKMQNKEKTQFMTEMVKRYLGEFDKDSNYSIEQISTLVFRYIYYVFNNDANTVLSLMNYKGEKLIGCTKTEHFSAEEANLINAFLNWDDKEKNLFVYNAISCCYEYCMMTVRKDNSSFKSIFKGKEFYLDANVIFRLAGFNNNERQEVMEAFIKKCSDSGIKLKFTNFTNIEVKSTLTHQVNIIKSLLNGQEPVRTEAMLCLSSKYANLDFYDKYIEWTKNLIHKWSDYESFLKHLNHEVEKHTNKMEFVRVESFERNCDKKEFSRLCDDFTEYKTNRFKGTYEGSIKTDIENYLFMEKLNADLNSNSFSDKKYFFITADHSYINWAREKTPGAIPTIILPSVWYSIILKYKGRTDNDYNAFCQFLNLRINTPEDDFVEKKEEMLAYILEIEESAQIKEEIISDINRRLCEETREIDDVESFVKESHKRVTEDRIKLALVEAEKKHENEKKNLSEKLVSQNKISDELQFMHGKNSGFDEGHEEGINKVINAQVKSIVLRNRNIRRFALIAFVLLSIAAIFFEVSKGNFVNDSTFFSFLNNNSGICWSIEIFLVITSGLLSQINKCFDILSLDEKVVEKKIRSRLI